MKMRLLLSGLALLLGIIPVPADITNGLVAYYNFEGLAGTVGETIVDQSGHGHDGVCRQDQGTLKAPALVPGPDGLSDALNFDGSFYVQIPNRPDFNISDNITLAAWISVDALTQDWQTIFCRGDWSWRLHRNGGSDYACFHMSGPSGGYGADGQTINIRVPKRWLHVVGTYKDGVGAKLYINGTLEASNPGVSGLINTDGDDPVTIGAQINNGSLVRQWQGQIDEVRLYGRALSATDVSELFGFVQTNFNSRPLVIVPADQVLNAPTNLLLAVTVSDDGKPLPADPANPSPNDPHKLRWNWSVVSAPSASAGVVWSGNSTNGEAFTYQGSSNPPGTVFTCRPTATFDAPGIYTLQFGANDGEKASSKNVTVWVRSRDDYRSLGYVYLSPLPGAEYTPTQTRFVLVRFQNVSPTSITNLSTFIRVNGVQSGVHTGQTKIAGDGRTVIFEMTADFVANEMVTVSLTPGVPTAAGGPVQPYLYQFVTSGHLPGLLVSSLPGSAPSTQAGGRDIRPAIRSDLTASNGVAGIMPNGVSVPSDFPWINITVNNKPDPEPIFIDNRGGNGRPYNVIFDNTGSPIWYRRMPDERRDMKVQHNGVLTMLARDNGQYFYGMNTNYQTIATYRTVNGYSVDEHELQVLADGTYFLIGLHSENVDLSRYIPGGSSSASVTEDCIQQFTPAGELIFQWRAWDYLDIASQQYVVTPTNPGDFPHMNAIDVDTDGHILLSGRNTSEVTKINRDTGQIIWRLGGTHNQFTFANDPLNGPRNQHSVRSVGTNRYTLFDNGNGHSPQVSRAVEYLVNPTNMTATVIWRYPATPTTSLFSYYMGNAQRLPNGNTLINWALGNLPKLTEVRPDGTKAFEMNWVNGYEAYRVWRCPWQGSALQPYLILESYPDNVTLIFNQFGDTNVGYYRIYGGTSPQSTNLLATSGVTMKQLTNLKNDSTYYFRVTAVNRQGVEGASSNEESTTVNIIKPGQNMIANGDFSLGTGSWTWSTNGTASATWSSVSGAGFVHVISPGTALTDIQLQQAGLKLVQGNQYVLEFDAWASAARAMEVRVGQNQSPWTSYKIASPSLTSARQHYAYPFTMQNTTDLNARLLFNVGAVSRDVYLDNVSVWMVAPGDLNRDRSVDFYDLSAFAGQWLRQGVGLSPDLNGDGTVDFRDFGVLGENWSKP